MRTALVVALLSSTSVFAQAPTGLAAVFDQQISVIEGDVLPLARKMPADKYNFAPATGTPPAGKFDGVRTFGQQVRHLATDMYMAAGAALAEKPPVSIEGPDDNGPANITSKEDILKYLEGALAFAHKAARSITAANATQPATMMGSKAGAVGFITWHSFDHYGQMVVYARLNGITPGADAPPQSKGKGKAK